MSHDLPADKLAAIQAQDGFANLRNGLRRLGEKTAEWAGIPMPLDDLRLVIEPTYPLGPILKVPMAVIPAKPDVTPHTLASALTSGNTRAARSRMWPT